MWGKGNREAEAAADTQRIMDYLSDILQVLEGIQDVLEDIRDEGKGE